MVRLVSSICWPAKIEKMLRATFISTGDALITSMCILVYCSIVPVVMFVAVRVALVLLFVPGVVALLAFDGNRLLLEARSLFTLNCLASGVLLGRALRECF